MMLQGLYVLPYQQAQYPGHRAFGENLLAQAGVPSLPVLSVFPLEMPVFSVKGFSSYCSWFFHLFRIRLDCDEYSLLIIA